MRVENVMGSLVDARDRRRRERVGVRRREGRER